MMVLAVNRAPQRVAQVASAGAVLPSLCAPIIPMSFIIPSLAVLLTGLMKGLLP